MFDLFLLSQLPIFLLVLVRTTGFFLMAPLFSYRTIPMPFKIGFSFFLSIVMTVSISQHLVAFDSTYILLILKELIFGLAMGLIAYIILAALQIAGGFIDFQMGFAIANVVDPQTGAQSPLIGQYFYIFALLFLLSVDGHHMLIDGLYTSFKIVPLDHWIQFGEESFASFIVTTFSKMFIVSFQIAIPIVGCLFLVDVALGMVARTVPQLNVFVVGLPIKIFVSFVAILVFLALYMNLTKRLFHYMLESIHSIMQLLGGV